MERIALCLEDDEKMPISQALKMSYNGDNIYFSEGNEFLAEKMHECIKSGYSFVIGFMDYPPDNEYIKDDYENAISYLIDNDLIDKTLLLPIVCTEFYVLLVLDHLGCLDLGQAAIPVWARVRVGRQHDLAGHSLEKVCKWILGESVRPCQRNTNKGKLGGMFYKIDCLECWRHCLELEKVYKCEWIYSGLPYFDVVSEEHRILMNSLKIPLNSVSINQAVSETALYFENLFKEYHKEFSIL